MTKERYNEILYNAIDTLLAMMPAEEVMFHLDMTEKEYTEVVGIVLNDEEI